MMPSSLTSEILHWAENAVVSREGTDGSQLETCRAIVRLVKSDVPKDVIERTLADPRVREVRPHLRAMMAQMETLQEVSVGQDLLSNEKLSMEVLLTEPRLFAEWYIGLVARECELFGDNLPHRTVFVGSGAIPLSPILLHRELRSRGIQLPVVGLEIDRSFFQLSTQMLCRLGLDDIEIAWRDGCVADYSEYENVIVASLAEPLEQILERVSGFINVKRVIVRGATGLATLIYRDVAMDLVERCGFRIASCALSDRAMNGSYLLQRL